MKCQAARRLMYYHGPDAPVTRLTLAALLLLCWDAKCGGITVISKILPERVGGI